MKDKSGTATSKELSLWKRRFKIFFYGTPLTVTGFFIAQICATKGSFSTEFSSLENWKTFTETFNLPIGVFTAMAAITTLIGMYYRSLQLAHQLNKVEDQIEIANKQFSKSSEQFELAQKQFNLASRKEHFMMFVEHKKQVSEIAEFALLRFEDSCKTFMGKFDYIPANVIDSNELYKALFPENSPNEITYFGLVTQNRLNEIKKSFITDELKRFIKMSSEKIDFDQVKPLLVVFGELGLYFKTTSYEEGKLPPGGIWVANFALDILKTSFAIHVLGVLDKDTHDEIHESCLDLAGKIIGLRQPT